MITDKMLNIDISLIVPCFNEEDMIPLFYKEVNSIIYELYNNGSIIKWEYIFIDDGSYDNTLNIIKNYANQDNNVHYISFSRNFGKEAAMLAGLKSAKGEYILLLDVDLQHPPFLIKKMLEIAKKENYDCVVAKRTRKGEPLLRTLFSKCFYKIISKLADMEIIDGAGDFRLMNKNYVNCLLFFDERNRFSKGMYTWIGFKTKYIEYENIERIAGITKWNFFKLFSYSLDGIIAFSTKLLAFSSIIGIISFFISFFFFILLILRKIIFNVSVDGWTTIVCLIIFFGGIILLSIGILGQYLAKIYIEVKHRPQYIIKEMR